MQPISQSDENQRPMETNGHIQGNGNNGKKATSTTTTTTINNAHDASTTAIMKQNGNHTITDEQQKITLPDEMACMVPLKTLIGKMIRKAHADLMTLTDTLPSRGEVEKKRQILNYAILVRKQIIKLQVLVKWADNAEDIQMCQNIMAFLANQNQIFRDSTHFLHKIHAELPKARIRNFDILSAVDVLTTGSYQRMPTKFQSIPTPLTDNDVLDTFSKINDVIRMRMMTTEVLPSPMKNYRIESGRIKFLIQNEFDVSLTLMGAPHEQRWWIVALNVLVKSTAGNGTADVDISLNEQQMLNLRMNAQKQLVPPLPTHQQQQHQQQHQQQSGTATTPADNTSSSAPVYFPLVNLYDYLHLFCLNMQLEIIYMQAMMASRTRWLDQLRVFMDATRTKLTLIYWKGGSAAAQWARPQLDEGGEKAIESQGNNNSTVIEISISNETDKRKGPFTPQVNMAISIRDELKGLIEQAGLGASVELSKMDNADRPKIVSALKYPKNQLDVLWGGDSNLHTNADLLNPSDIDVERVLWHVTRHHSLCIIEKLRTVLKAQEAFLNENGLHLVEGRLEDVISDLETAATDDLKDQLYINEMKMDISPVIVRYRHHRYININLDMRSGRIKVREAGYRLGEGDAKLKELEERLNSDPSNVSKHLLWLRSEVVIRETVSLAKQLSLQPFHTSQMSLRADDLVKLFGDILSAPTTASQNTTLATDHPHAPLPGLGGGTAAALNSNRLQYPSHCVFLQFAQFKDWYLVVTIVQNEVYSCLCCINEKRDANGLFQVIVDMMYMDYEAMWKEQFMPQILESANSKKRRSHVDENDKENEHSQDNEENFHKKRRKTFKGRTDANKESNAFQNIDNLSIDLRFMAKLDSLCRAFITNRKVELQLVLSSVTYMSRPLLKSLPTAESQVLNHPAANKMEVLCVPQRELLKACAARNVDDTHHAQHPGGVGKEIPLHVRPWVEKMTPRMKNDVLMRASGWWACGRNECFVVMQDKFDWKNIPLPIRDFNADHISLDRPSNVLSFTYTDIDSCINRFIIDWERIYMMANLARQSSSAWLGKYNDQLEFDNFNMQELKFTYAKKFTCIIRWDSPNPGRARQYIVDVGMKDEYEKNTTKDDSNNSNEAITLLHLSVSRNPHWRVASFLQDILNDKRDVVYLIQVLFQTLPFMMSLEKLELHNTLNGSIGDVSIIPRAVDSVRIIYVSRHALDIWFTNPNTICVSDAAFQHKLPSISSLSLRNENSNKTTPSQSSPAITNNKTNTPAQQQSDSDTTDNVKPVKLSQDFQFIPFTEFDGLLRNVETWIFDDDHDDSKENEEISCFSLLPSMDESEPTAVPFKHGVICSASLCRTLISQLGSLKEQEKS